MKLTFEDIATKLNVRPDAVGRKFREINPGGSFDKYAVANGSTVHILNGFIDSRNPKTARAAKKLLEEYLDSESVKIVHSEESPVEAEKKAHTSTKTNWMAILPLPMLGLAASYGVFSFSSLFFPQWMAIVEASAFELVYIGLAAQTGLSEKQRRSANRISIAAMAVSVLYNTAAGIFHRMPELLEETTITFEVFLAVLHGLPIPVLAWAVADLLLHQKRAAHV